MNLSAPSLLSPEGIASLKLFSFCYHPIEPMNTRPTGHARPLRGNQKPQGQMWA